MSTADTQTSPTASTPPRSRRGRWRWLVCGLAIGGLWLTSGRGGMGEFSPYTLQCRSRSEYTILFGHIPVYRSQWHYWPNPLIEFLRAEGFASPMASEEERWEGLFHWNHAWKTNDNGLYRDLCRDKQGTIEWCKEDRARAEFYWTELFRMLRSDWYLDHQMADYIAMNRLRWHVDSAEALRRVVAETRAGILDTEIWAIDEYDRSISAQERDHLERELAAAKCVASGKTD